MSNISNPPGKSFFNKRKLVWTGSATSVDGSSFLDLANKSYLVESDNNRFAYMLRSALPIAGDFQSFIGVWEHGSIISRCYYANVSSAANINFYELVVTWGTGASISSKNILNIWELE